MWQSVGAYDKGQGHMAGVRWGHVTGAGDMWQGVEACGRVWAHVAGCGGM